MPGVVYFIGVDPDGPIKIGWTAKRPDDRLRTLQTANYQQLRMLATMFDPSQTLEGVLHGQFASARIRGEWFERTPELMKFIGSRATPWRLKEPARMPAEPVPTADELGIDEPLRGEWDRMTLPARLSVIRFIRGMVQLPVGIPIGSERFRTLFGFMLAWTEVRPLTIDAVMESVKEWDSKVDSPEALSA